MSNLSNSFVPNLIALLLSLAGFWLVGQVVVFLAMTAGFQGGYILLINLVRLALMLVIVSFAGRFAGRNTHTARRLYAIGFASGVALPDLVNMNLDATHGTGLITLLGVVLVFYRACYSHLKGSMGEPIQA